MVKPPSSNLCEPRWATRRNPDRETLGPAVAAVAEGFGQPLMPWQRQVADVGLEILPDGRPAYREVTVTVPRQSGKTTLVLSWEIQRALGWTQLLGAPQRIAYSAQTGKDAREKLLDDQWPLLTPHRRLFGIDRPIRTNGSEAIIWKNGSRLILLASGSDSGHGKTLDLGVKDELFADVDFRRDQALNPAMATRAHAQILTASTMGTLESIPLNSAVEAGRAAVDAGQGSGVAYFEWSAHPDNDPADPETWWRCMPALGRTISLEVVQHAFQTLPLGEFRRAYTNVMTDAEERVIPKAVWDAVCVADVEAVGELFAVDMNHERSAGGIVAIGAGPVVEVVDYRPGTAWLIDRCVELSESYGAAPFAVDKTGPAGVFIDELTRRGVKVVETDAINLTRACGAFYDRVFESQITIRTNSDLDRAVAGAEKRPVGDSWVWTRKNSKLDISLLVAASIGVWALLGQTESAPMIRMVSR